jgi:hypothetical protein
MSKAEAAIRRFFRAVSDAVMGRVSSVVESREDLGIFHVSQVETFNTVRSALFVSNLLGSFVAWSSLRDHPAARPSPAGT